MLAKILICVALLLVCDGHTKLYQTYRRAECSSIITASGGYLLPYRVHCNVKVRVPQGNTTVDFFWPKHSISCESLRNELRIIDDATQAEYSPCENDQDEEFSFSAKSDSYTIMMVNLSRLIYMHVEVLEPKYRCNDRLKYEVFGNTVELINTQRHGECLLALPTNSIVRITRPKDSKIYHRCDTKIEIQQGPHVEKAVMSTGYNCLDDEALEFSVFCQSAVLKMRSPRNSSVMITVLSPTEEVDREHMSKYFSYCVNKRS